ncbi:MAG TPA: carbamoyltransferase [Nitrospirae bacterium]|nr:carbamoyltransferase [Nitrospirota bacterium]
MIILGLNAYYGDSSACIVADGELIAAAEEERFTRIKHWAGFPSEAIIYCLNEAGIEFKDIDHIAVNRKPNANLLKKALFALSKRPSLKSVADRIRNANRIRDIGEVLNRELSFMCQKIKAEVHTVEHHVAHLSSSFFVSPFKEAALVSMDCFGDFVGTMWGKGVDNMLEIGDRVFFPHSLGLFYLSVTQYLGFFKYGDEHKVMGLAAHGEPEFMKEMREILKLADRHASLKDGKLFNLDLEFFTHQSEGVAMTWNDKEPVMRAVFSKKLEDRLGPARKRGEEISERHKNIAASLQKRYEEVFFHILNMVYKETGSPNLVLSGGCAMNSMANGKIFDNTPFREVYIQPAAGDAGGAIGAAFYVWNQLLGMPRSFVLDKPYLGPGYSDYKIKQVLDSHASEIEKEDCRIRKMKERINLCRDTARAIADGNVVGWFQGRMEWGPRALGNRSIVCDPRRHDMKDILNSRIRSRESFRAFAPSIQLETTGEYFETDYPDPFMLKVYKIRPEKREIIPAVTQVDGSGRLQTVRREDNPLYWQLIEEFRKITDVPVVLNASFNENEPIVRRPEDALDCFLKTKMDVLVMGNFFISRT